MAVCASEAHDEQFGILSVAQHFEVWHGDVGNLAGTLACHQVVVLGIGADGTRLVVLFQSAQDVLESLASGHGPVACAVFGTHVGCPLSFQFFGHVRWLYGRIILEIGQAEGTRAVGHEGICQQHHGCHVFQCNLRCLIGCVEAVGGAHGSHHWHGALAVTSEEHLQQVCLLALGGQSGGWASALYVEHHDG